jgi:hypothetical protein
MQAPPGVDPTTRTTAMDACADLAPNPAAAATTG